MLAAGAYGAVTLVRSTDDPPAPVTARDTAGRRADDALLDAIESRFSAEGARPRTPPAAARREYRDWIAARFGPARDDVPLPAP